MGPSVSDLLELDLERRQSALGQEGCSPRALESWAEPPYDILCPLECHEVPDVSRWGHIYGAPKMDRGLYLCQPLFGCHREVGANCTPCWLLALRILVGPAAEKILFRTFWLSERTIERSTADLRRLGLPPSVARQTVEFDRGGVLAVVEWRWNQDDRDLPYQISSMTTLAGIAALHAEVLDYARAKREQTGIKREPCSLPAALPTSRAFTR